MEGITYRPLDYSTREIRLIVLEERGANPRAEGPLKCKLVHASLGSLLKEQEIKQAESEDVSSLKLNPSDVDTPEISYHALSYVWGLPIFIHEIEVDGEIVKVTQSLGTALETIFQQTDIRSIWADALCINQNDIEEKSWQVGLMKDIYERASAVVAWLGPASDDSDLAITLLTKMVDAVEEAIPKLSNPPRRYGRAMLQDEVKQTFGSNPASYYAVAALLTRPYWKRIWIVQEITLAKSAIFLCGKTSAANLDSAIFVLMAFGGFGGGRPFAGRDDIDSLIADIHFEAEGMFSIVRACKSLEMDRPFSLLSSEKPDILVSGNEKRRPLALTPEPRRPLLDLILRSRGNSTQSLAATDPRDLIFGLLGISADAEAFNIVPNYSRNVQDVFKATTKRLVCGGQVRALAYSNPTLSMPGLPSWATDWSKALNPYSGEMFSASGPRRFRLLQLTDEYLDSDELIVSGIVIGEVEKTAPPTPTKDLDDESLIRGVLRDWVLDVEQHLLDPDPTADINPANPTQEFSTTTTTEEPISQPPTHSPIRALYGSPLSAQQSILSSTLVSDWDSYRSTRFGTLAPLFYKILLRGFIAPDLLPPDLLIATSIGDFRTLDQLTDYVATLTVQALQGRKPFRLATGYLGSGPGELVEGDVVVVLEGLGIPVILRRVRERVAEFAPECRVFAFVGTGYVHGVMDGEVVEQQQRGVGGWEREIIVLV